ncbi:MAG: DEAD/DEAH box helicase [Caldilineaceae bacterium]|nr:DEAD/DEAH box helicase [Caldilineaceae bacterium]
MGFLAKVGSWLRPVKVVPLELSYRLDLDAQGRHLVRFARRVNGHEEPVSDAEALLRYDYRELSADGRTVYVIGAEDRTILLAMGSLNPQRVDHQTLAFEVTPPILTYLRRKPAVQETPDAQEMTIATQPVKPVAKVDFDPKDGLSIQAGYPAENGTDLVPPSALQRVGGGSFVRIGKTLAPLAQVAGAAAQELLQKGQVHISLEQIPEYFTRDLVLLKQEFSAVLTDRAQQILVVDTAAQPVVQVRKTSPGWLDFQVEYQIGDRTWAHEQLMHSGAGRYQRLDATTWAHTNAKQLAEVQKQLNELGAQPLAGGYRLPVARFASLEEFIDAIGGQRALSEAYQAFLAQLTDFQADAAFVLPQPVEQALAGHHIQLRPYQREGIHWLSWLSQNRLHGLLADDMGLGKTLQAICAMAHAYHAGAVQEHSLVIAPKSVLIHWQREIRRCLPQTQVRIYHGPYRAALRRLFAYRQPIIFISTYATVANDVEHLVQVPFFYVILDEATQIKNPNAQRTRGIKALNAAHRVALSGTPIENRPAELWSLFDFLMRDHLGRYGTFQSRFETPILNGDQQATEKLGRRIRPFMLRRRKEEVARDLPDKIPIVAWCDLTEEQRSLYGSLQGVAQEIREALRRGEQVSYTGTILPVLTKLKQICDHPALVTEPKQPVRERSEKFDLVVEKIQEILGQGEQVVVFSHFLGMLDLLQHELMRLAVPWIRIDGSTEQRQTLVDRFNRREAKVALCSLMAAGHGITLTSANHVIHADRWWNPAVEDQATDRVHRIGQDKTVYVYHFLTEGTLEETIDDLLERKRDLAGQVMGAADQRRLHWTRDDLIEILKPLR